MKNIILTSCSFLICFSCSRVDLISANAESIIAEVKLAKGSQAVLLNIWATSCPPCVAEFPMIVNLGKNNSELNVLFVSTDFIDQLNQVNQFLHQYGVVGKSFIKNQKDQSFINGLHTEWTGALPFTIVFAKNSGEVVDYWEGIQHQTRFNSAIERAIKL